MRRLFAILLATSLVLAACGSDDKESDSSDKSDGTTTTVANSSTVAGAKDVPNVTIPDPLPKKLTITDVKEGTGEELGPYANVTVDYVGKGANTGKVFDDSYSRGEPATFSLHGVIPGWSEGLVGMKVGGVRELVIPADMAYGDNPDPASGIEPGETLVFRVELISFETDPNAAKFEVVDKRGEPKVEVPDPLPNKLTTTDDVVGKGAEVTATSAALIQFVAVSADTGKVIDSSWTGGPVGVTVANTVPAWTEGLPGMREGGRRTIVAPVKEVFGGAPPADMGVAEDDTLIFVIDVILVEEQPDTTGGTDLPGETGSSTTVADDSTATTTADEATTTTAK